MTLLQLNVDRGFYQLVKTAVRVKTLILCEGRSDVEIVKELTKGLGLKIREVGILDCGGIDRLRDICPCIVALVTVSRSVDTIAVIVDSNKMEKCQRGRGLYDSLCAHLGGNAQLNELQELEEGLYQTKVRFDRKSVIIYICVVGDFKKPLNSFKTHEIEDHVVRLLLLKGRRVEIGSFNTAKAVLEVHGIDALEEIRVSDPEDLRRAFGPLATLLGILSPSSSSP